jgi:glucan biosynthesis protein C
VYLIHPPVLIGLALLLARLQAAPPVKALLLTLVTAVISFALADILLRRIPGLRRIL